MLFKFFILPRLKKTRPQIEVHYFQNFFISTDPKPPPPPLCSVRLGLMNCSPACPSISHAFILYDVYKCSENKKPSSDRGLKHCRLAGFCENRKSLLNVITAF